MTFWRWNQRPNGCDHQTNEEKEEKEKEEEREETEEAEAEAEEEAEKEKEKEEEKEEAEEEKGQEKKKFHNFLEICASTYENSNFPISCFCFPEFNPSLRENRKMGRERDYENIRKWFE